MGDHERIEELRRRVRKDPASLAFAPLAEELRRARRFMEAVAVCRTGLEIYPGYLSARVTLGRCFIDLNRLDDAEKEIQKVREVAPENLAVDAGLTSPSSVDPLTGSERAVEGPDAIYDGATFEVWSKPAPSAHPSTPFRPTWGLSRPGAVEGPDVTSDSERSHAVRTLAALEAWLDAIHVTRASRSA